MGRGKPLSEAERVKVKIYAEGGLSHNEIAKKINKSQNCVSNFLRNENTYGKNMKGGTYRATSATERRAIVRSASNSKESAAKIKEKVGSKASLATVKRVIQNAKHLKRLKLQKKPPLNPLRKEHRLKFAENYMTWKDEWKRVVFSDEKKFNLDGPDGFNYYFHDLRKEKLYLEQNHSCAGGVMVWGAISYYGTVELQFLSTKMNAVNYKGVLEKAFPLFNDIFGPISWTFQHDNAPIHTARLVKQWIDGQNVGLLQWPPYSPDLNIIENVWGFLSRKVYESGRQFENKNDLIAAIQEAWSEINLNYLAKLYDSMPKRIFEIILNKGGSTHY